jgi:hypothetical protein
MIFSDNKFCLDTSSLVKTLFISTMALLIVEINHRIINYMTKTAVLVPLPIYSCQILTVFLSEVTGEDCVF